MKVIVKVVMVDGDGGNINDGGGGVLDECITKCTLSTPQCFRNNQSSAVTLLYP